MALTKINASVIANNTIAVGNIADNSVDATKIASNSILTRHIDDDQITGDQLADNISIAGTLTSTGAFTSPGIDDNADATAITIDSSERVGIGTASPSFTLHVLDTIGTRTLSLGHGVSSGTITTDSAKDLNFQQAGTTMMTLDSAGNVGIGTSSPNNDTNRVSLELDDTWGGIFQNSVSGTPKSEWKWNTSGYTIFGSVANENLAFITNSTERMTIDTSGNVTTGGHLLIGGSNNELRFYEGSNYVGFEAPALSADKIWVLPAADGSNGQVIKTDGSGNLSFATVSGTTINNNADNRIITGSGTANTLEGEANLRFDGTNLVLDAAGASVSADDVFGAINFFDQDGGSSAAGVTSSIKSIAVGAVGASKLTFSNSTSGGGARSSLTEKMVIDESGRVGIGTTDPSSGYGGAITAAKVAILSGVSGNNGGSSTLLIGGDNKHYAYMQGTHTSGGSTELDFGTANGANNPTLKMKIDSSGNITAPNQPSFMCFPNAYTHSAGATQKTFENESFDKGGNYNTSNGRFTAPVAGRYMFLCEVAAYTSSTALTYLGIGVRKNGSGSVYWGGWESKHAGSYGKSSSTVILELAASDYIEVYIETSATHGIYGAEGGQNTRWSGQLLS